MNTKHTPGPWSPRKQDGNEWWFGGKGGAEIVIRPLGGPSYDCIAVIGADLSRETEADANARLIAAAPELLEALMEVVRAADGDGWAQLDPSFAKQRAAIRAATGEQA